MTYRLIHGDCLDVMRSMDSASVDAVVTDPPYGLDFRGEAWDAFIPKWLVEARRLSRGVVAFTTAPTTMWDYPRPDWVLSSVRPGSTSRTAYGGFNHWTPVLVYGSGKWTPDVHSYPDILRVTENAGIDHPCPKPVALMRWIVRGALPNGGEVLDPFMGSGTTGVAALDEGCDFVGIDTNAEYVKIAEARLKHASRAPMLPLAAEPTLTSREADAVAAQLAFDLGIPTAEAKAVVTNAAAKGAKGITL